MGVLTAVLLNEMLISGTLPSGGTVTDSVDPSLCVKIAAGLECKSDDTNIGRFMKPRQCAAAAVKQGGVFFIFGTGSRQGNCYIEHTSSATCPEGWEVDKYDFYSCEATARSRRSGHKPLYSRLETFSLSRVTITQPIISSGMLLL